MQMRRKASIHASRKKTTVGAKEKRRLFQLLLCVTLFLIVFLGKGIAPEEIARSGQRLLSAIHANTDFKDVFSALGKSFFSEESEVDVLGMLTGDAFEAELQPTDDDAPSNKVIGSDMPTTTNTLTQTTIQDTNPTQHEVTMPETEATEFNSSQEPEIPIYTGPALPDGATMEYVELGLSQTVTPVMGELTSAYGYRDHPVNGEYSFHTGIDLSADLGVPIVAFADGTVDFIGESEAYGLYIQLDHGNGITTFYCHCSDLYARKGEKVTAGQVIAAVGNSGNVTGSHLHLELEQNDVLLNPAYYVETAS